MEVCVLGPSCASARLTPRAPRVASPSAILHARTEPHVTRETPASVLRTLPAPGVRSSKACTFQSDTF